MPQHCITRFDAAEFRRYFFDWYTEVMELFYLILLTIVAVFVGTVTGFGTSTIMVPVVSIFLSIPETLLFVGVLHWFSDIWKILLFKRGFNWRLILLFGIPGVIVSFGAARLPLVLEEDLLQRFLGIFLIGYVGFLFFKREWKIRSSGINALLGGSLSGFFAGIFGVGGAIRSTFLSAFNLKKSVFLFTSGVIGLLIDSSRVSQYWLSGVRLDSNLRMSLIVCIPISLVGAYLAKKVVDRVPQESFRLVVAMVLLLVGLRYLFWG